MAALAANKEVVEQDGNILSMPVVATDIIYKGALVKVNAAGYLAPCAPEAGSTFAGVAYEQKDNSAGAAGALECRAMQVGCHVMDGSGFTQADVGSMVYALEDNLITLTEGADKKQIVGKIVKFLSATQVLVKITPFVGTGA